MILSWFLFQLVFVAVCAPFFAAGAHGSESFDIRVRISDSAERPVVRGFDLAFYERVRGQEVSVRQMTQGADLGTDKTTEWELDCRGGKVKALSLVSSPSKKAVEFRSPVILKSKVGFISFGSRIYRNELRIFSIRNVCQIVNHVSIEKYLDGLVNSEFSSKWNEEAIAAQVVAARTYAHYQMLVARKKRNSYFDVDSTVKDQVYDGSTKEKFNTSQIVTKTQGLILVPKGSLRDNHNSDQKSRALKPIKAFYHSTCGGRTELPQNVWGETYPGFQRSVKCPYCISSSAFRWQLDLSLAEVEGILIKKNAVFRQRFFKNARLVDVKTGPLNTTRRISQVTTVWASDSNPQRREISISGSRFREWIGPGRLKSTVFQVMLGPFASLGVNSGGKNLRFQGLGNGHGVGLCQWGAKVMGERGFNMAQILNYYYPDAAIRKLW